MIFFAILAVFLILIHLISLLIASHQDEELNRERKKNFERLQRLLNKKKRQKP